MRRKIGIISQLALVGMTTWSVCWLVNEVIVAKKLAKDYERDNLELHQQLNALEEKYNTVEAKLFAIQSETLGQE